MRGRWLTSSAVFLILSILGIVIGGVLRWGADDPDAANLVWALTTAIGIVPIGWEVLSGILHRQPGVDLIAVLAMAGALALEEYLAGAVIAFMLATGRTLEDFADARAHRELSALLERAPRSAHRYREGSLSSVPDRGGATGRPAARQARRGRAGRRAPRLGHRGARRVRADRRVPARRTERGRADPFGRGQRRRGVRPARGRERRPKHVRRHRPAGRAGSEGEGAVRPPGRPVRA